MGVFRTSPGAICLILSVFVIFYSVQFYLYILAIIFTYSKLYLSNLFFLINYIFHLSVKLDEPRCCVITFSLTYILSDESPNTFYPLLTCRLEAHSSCKDGVFFCMCMEICCDSNIVSGKHTNKQERANSAVRN